MQFKHVTLDFDGPVAILKLDHQEVMNAVSMDMLGGLGEALDAIDDKREEVRCLVLTGAGRAFCTGANLQGRNKPGKSNAGSSLEIGFHPFLRRLRRLHCPIVSAVNGPAAGAGMSFALMGDMIVCARSSYFLQAFRRIGLVPDCGSTWLLPRMIGKARSVELSLMGERLPAEKALEWGLINRVYDDAVLMEEAMTLAHDLAKPSGGASQATWTFDIVLASGNTGAILRRAPPGYGASPGRAAGLDAEATLMQLAHDAGLPSPRVMHVLKPEDELGTGFIMQRIEGETIARKILRDEQFAKARPIMERQLGRIVAGIHGLPASKLPKLRHMTSTGEIADLEREYRGFDWPRPVFE